MHTNLDAAKDGVNDALCAALGAENLGLLELEDTISRLCRFNEAMDFSAFLAHVKSALNANGLRYAGPEKPVRLFGICGGSGGDSIMAAKQRGCDAFVTADVKHHQFIWAEELDIDVVDARALQHGERGRPRAGKLDIRALPGCRGAHSRELYAAGKVFLTAVKSRRGMLCGFFQ